MLLTINVWSHAVRPKFLEVIKHEKYDYLQITYAPAERAIVGWLMVCPLFATKPLSVPVLTYYQWDSWNRQHSK